MEIQPYFIHFIHLNASYWTTYEWFIYEGLILINFWLAHFKQNVKKTQSSVKTTDFSFVTKVGLL